MHPKAIRHIAFFSDLIWIGLSAIAAYLLRTGIPWTAANLQLAFHSSLFLMLTSGIVWIFVFDRLKLDGFYGGYEIAALVSQLFIGVTVLILLVASAGFLVKDYFSRLILLYFAGFLFLAAFGARLIARTLANKFSHAGRRRRVLILGSGKVAQELANRIKRHPEMRWQLAGFLFPSQEDSAESIRPKGKSTPLNALQIEPLLEREQVDEIVLAPHILEQPGILNLIANCRRRRIRISLIPHLYQLYVTRPALMDLDGLPLLTLGEHGPTWLQAAFKRTADVLLSLLILILFSPVLSLSAILLKLRRGKAFASEARCGRNGRIFRMYRFNSRRAADGITAAEPLLQKLSFTEFPQLINVLKGEMSLVGPRPETEERVKRYSEWQRQRLVVKPGMTGLAQVHGLREENSSEDKAYFDLRYIQNFSFLTDLSLILQTVWTLGARFLSDAPAEVLSVANEETPAHPVEFLHADRS